MCTCVCMLRTLLTCSVLSARACMSAQGMYVSTGHVYMCSIVIHTIMHVCQHSGVHVCMCSIVIHREMCYWSVHVHVCLFQYNFFVYMCHM